MALVLLNPHAQGGRARRLHAPLRDWLAAHAPQARLQLTDTVAAARSAIEAAPARSRIVVVGGDGTLHQLLPALVARGAEVGLVPAGSGDDTARAFGLRGRAWPEALALALRHEAMPIDLGEVCTPHETRWFASSLAAGFDAAVAERALAAPRWLAGLPRYLWATMAEVGALHLHRLRIAVDGRPVHDGPALFASTLNTSSYGGGMPVVPTARIDDGRLDLVIAGRFGRLGTLAMLPRLLAGRHLGHPEVSIHAGTRLQLDADAPLPLAADGEPMAAAARVVLQVRPAALRVVRVGS